MMSTPYGARPLGFCLVALILLPIIGCGQKDDPRLSSPKSAARTLFQAMYDNDLATAKSCITNGSGQVEITESFTGTMVAMRAAGDAAHKRFGEEFAKLAGGALDTMHIDPKQIDQGSETIKGESATIVFAGGKTTLHLVRQDKAWKVDMVRSFAGGVDLADPELLAVATSMFSGATKAANRTKAEIEAGKYPSAQPAVQALLANMKNAIEQEKQRAIKKVLERGQAAPAR